MQQEDCSGILQQAGRSNFKASAVPILAYFYILCNNKNYKKASEFLRARCYERTGFDELQ